MIDVINDVVFFADVISGTDNPDRLVKSDVNEIFLGSAYRFVVYGDYIARQYFGAHFWYRTIDHDPSAFDELVGSSARAIANFTEVFIDADAFCLVHNRFDSFAKVLNFKGLVY